jgi:2-phosphosulfolactate phosphatase
MAITAVSMGRRCYPVDTLDAAFRLARKLDNPLLAGELAGEMPAGFEMNNSPAELAKRDDICRPLIMLSSSGTRLIMNARGCDALYLACFRNSASLSRRLAQGTHPKIALLGAGSRGEFREEDQIGCAWIAANLVEAGYLPKNERTLEILKRWGDANATDCLVSQSVGYLRKTDQLADLDFILDKIDDLEETFILQNEEIVLASEMEPEWQPDLVPAY